MTPFLRRGIRPVLTLVAILVARDGLAAIPAYVTQWGTYGSADGEFKYPAGLDLVANTGLGTPLIYVADAANHRVQALLLDGSFFSTFGTQGSGAGQVIFPQDVTARGNIYVTDQGNNRVQVWSDNGTYIGGFGSPGSGSGQFNGPTGIAVDAGGSIYVTDSNNNRIEKFHDDGGGSYSFVTQWAVTGRPLRLALGPDGNLYVVTELTGNVAVYTTSGASVRSWALGLHPRGIAVAPTGDVFATDTDNHRIKWFSSTGTLLAQWGTHGSSPGQFVQPSDVTVDSDGFIYVLDTGNHRIQVFHVDVTPPTVSLTSPVGGEVWDSQAIHSITWTATDNAGVASIDLSYSYDGGAHWSPIATGTGNTGSYNWYVPQDSTTQARVRCQAKDVNGLTSVVTGGDFTVVPAPPPVTGVDPRPGSPPELRLSHPAADAAGGSVRLEFTTPSPGFARIDIVDLSGRRIWTWGESELDAGDHALSWDGHATSGILTPTGIYFVRLSARSGARLSRFAIVR